MVNPNRFYTYAYLRKNGTPYYIGKGIRDRIHNPLHNSIHLPPKERRIFLKQNLTEEEAFKHEIYMIAVFGRIDLGTGILRNMTNGGQGVSGRIVCEKQREKMRQYHKMVNHRQCSPQFFIKENQSNAGKKGGLTTRMNKKGIFSPDYDRTPAAKEAGKKGGSVCRDNKIGIFGMTEEQKKERSRKGSATVRAQRWKCKVTGYISNPCGLSNYQKSRGIDYRDKTLRERVM
jgi:general stress protein YciG